MQNVLSLQKMQTPSAQQDLMQNSWLSVSCKTARNSTLSLVCS
jgi:hypothetical protein